MFPVLLLYPYPEEKCNGRRCAPLKIKQLADLPRGLKAERNQP
ncbi:hypothetical protein NBRC111894_3837 [Sporolactobacillus inulinus]|uniref:Uncharacterized protein n=1 Tax=Sporolactobacillus inulinus TaxID=2078 RepID=A0A4Y1ZH57_9BACL|nr:hypothetical protein NBRC111894_3837 [Sporolactobacillus inulinus]